MTWRRMEPAIRLAVCLGLLALLWHYADGPGVVDQLGGMDARYALAALAVTVPQVAVSAWRWHFTASRLGLKLPYRRAFGEYYLATFLNQVLPGGMAGDAARAWRHGRKSTTGFGAAARVVILERTSGQIALFAVVLAAAVFEPDAFAAMMSAVGPWGGGLVAIVALIALAVRKSRWRDHLGVFLADFRHVFSGRSGGVQLLLSLFVVATYLMVYGLAARSIGVELSTGTLMTVVPVILFSMVVPVSISGWGVREAVAAAFASSAGLTPGMAVAISVAYGLIVLVSSLPGLFVLLAVRSADEADTLATSGR